MSEPDPSEGIRAESSDQISACRTSFTLPAILKGGPALNLLASPPSGDYLDEYLVLKSQRTMLSKLKRRLETDPVPAALKQTVAQLVSRLSALEDCCLTDLHSAATEELDFVRNVLCLRDLPPDLAHVVDPIFKALITVTKTLCSEKREPADQKVVSPALVRPDAPSPTLICRICEEPISLELFKCHTRSCISAYKSESRVAAMDDQLRRLDDLIRQLLPPGP
jgi:hypothetical protein